MSEDLLLSLLNNATLYAAVVLVSHLIMDKMRDNPVRDMLLGGAFGLFGVLGMMVPVELFDGMIFDGRNAVIIVVSFFFSWRSAVVAGVIIGAYRYFVIAGPLALLALTGVAMVVLAAILVSKYLKKHNVSSLMVMALLGGAIQAITLVFVYLLFLGTEQTYAVVTKVGLPLSISVTVAVLFISGLLMIDNRRRVSEEGLNLYAKVFENSGEAIVITNKQNKIIATNSAFSLLTGYSGEEVKGQNPKILSSGKTPEHVYQEMWANLNDVGFWQGELWDRKKTDEVYPKWAVISVIRNEQNEITNYIASYIDISERKAAEARVHYLAHYDVLTGVLNRFSLESQLAQALLAGQRDNKMIAVLFLDLDEFKAINDNFGHRVGDEILKQTGKRLQKCVRSSDIVARLGGDEFVVVLTDVESLENTVLVTEKILNELGRCYGILGNNVSVTPSIGICISPSDGNDPDTLLMCADTAMYKAKSLGRNNYQFYDKN